MNPWGATPFKKVNAGYMIFQLTRRMLNDIFKPPLKLQVVSLPTRIDPHHTSAVVTLNGQLFVRVPLEQLEQKHLQFNKAFEDLKERRLLEVVVESILFVYYERLSTT